MDPTPFSVRQSRRGGSNAFEKNSALRNSLLVPYQIARKLGSSANRITLPLPLRSAMSAALPSILAWFVSYNFV